MLSTARQIDEVRVGISKGIPATRMAFLGALGNPQAAIGAGTVLAGQLDMAMSLALDAGKFWAEAESNASELSLD